MVYKYEIVEVSPNTYSVLKYNKLSCFSWKSWVQNVFYDGAQTWSNKEHASDWVEDAIKYNKHIVKVVKVYEVGE